jgi:hypothetical protein
MTDQVNRKIDLNSKFLWLEAGLNGFDKAFGIINKLPGVEFPHLAKLALQTVGVPSQLVLACNVLLNTQARALALKVSGELRHIIAEWKHNGDFKVAIIHFIATLLEFHPDSEEYGKIVDQVAQVLDQQPLKAHRCEQFVRITLDAIRLIPLFQALNTDYQSYAIMGLEYVLPQLFERFLPEDMSTVAAAPLHKATRGEQPAADDVEDVEQPLQPQVVTQDANHSSDWTLKGVLQESWNQVGKIVTSDVKGRAQQIVLHEALKRSSLSQQVKQYLEFAGSLVNLLPGEAHVGLRIYQFSSLDHRCVILRLEDGAIFGNLQSSVQQHVEMIFSTMPQAQALISTPPEPHVQRLIDQSAACGSCAPAKAPAVQFQIVANVHYLFHHEVRLLFAHAHFGCFVLFIVQMREIYAHSPRSFIHPMYSIFLPSSIGYESS